MRLIAMTVQIVKLDCEGIPVLEKLISLREQKSKVKAKLHKLWRSYAETQDEHILNLIEMYEDVLKDYEEEIDYLINGLEEK